MCVLRDVRERLGDDEVHGRLDMRREAPGGRAHLDGNRRALGQRSYSRVEALVGEDRGVDAASELAKLAQCALCLRLCLVHEGCRLLVSVHSRPEQPKSHADPEQALLRSVVEISLEPSTLVVSRAHDSSPRLA